MWVSTFIYIYMCTLLVRLCTRPLASLSTSFSISSNLPLFSRILLNPRLNACLEWRGDGPGKSMAWPVTRSETLWGGGLEGHDLRWQLPLNLLIRLLLRNRGTLPVKQTTSQNLWPRISWWISTARSAVSKNDAHLGFFGCGASREILKLWH